MSEETTIFSPELEQAIRDESNAAKLRLAPDANLAALHAAFAKRGVILKVTENGLSVEDGTITARDVLVSASKDDALKNNFIVAGGKIRHLSEFSSDPIEGIRQRQEFIREHGPDKWERLVADSHKPALRPGVTIHEGMNAADWNNLSQSEKVRAVSAWGSHAPETIGKILNRKAAK